MTSVLDQLQTISRDLDNAITELTELEYAAAKAESAYRVAKAKAFMRSEGAVQARESMLAEPWLPHRGCWRG